MRRGHWIGLHFDEHYYADADTAELARLVERERAWLSEELGTPIEVVSFHQPSRRVLAGQVKIQSINTYDHNDMKGIHYVSDSNMEWKEASLDELFGSRKYRKLQVLIHPEWWTREEISTTAKWTRILSHNFELMQGSLLARERTYTQSQEIVIRVKEGLDK